MNIKDITSFLTSKGCSMGSIYYDNSERPLKNVSFGAKAVRKVKYGQAIDNILFEHGGKLYLRIVDNNDGHKPKTLSLNHVKRIKARNMVWCKS
jgi:hypothetical protein